ncbi:MAG: AraC family transcriptional regulator [Treponemataceae bacterium]
MAEKRNPLDADKLKKATLPRTPLTVDYGIPLNIHHYQRGSYEPHYHTFLELMIINKTSGAQEIDGEVYPFVAGQVYFLGTFHAHTIRQEAGLTCDYYNINFQPELVYGAGSEEGIGRFGHAFMLAPFYSPHRFNPVLLPDSAYESAKKICELLVEENSAPNAGSAEVVINLFNALISYIAKYVEPPKAANDEIAIRVLRHLSGHFRDSLTNIAIAERFGVSPSRLAQIFKAATGKTVKDMLVRRRLMEARRLLDVTDRPITEIALESGFEDLSYFDRAFKAATGLSPRGFRLRNRTKGDFEKLQFFEVYQI